MRRLKKVLIGVIIFFAVFTLFGFFALPPILKSILIKQLSQNLHREVTIEKISVNPYALSLTAKGFKVKDRQTSETFVSFDEMFINLQSLSAFKRALVLKEITLKKPYIKVTRREDMSYNFSDLIEKKEPKPEEKPKPSKPLGFAFHNISILNGSIDFSDEPKQTKHTVRDLNITVPFVSNIASQVNTYVQPALSAKVNETPYSLKGRTKPFADSHETIFDINIENLDIPYYLAYVPVKMNMKILSAYLDTKAEISFIQHKSKGPSLTVKGDVALKKLVVNDEKNNPLVSLPLLNVSIAPTEPIAKIIHLSKVSLQSPELYMRRHQTGAVNVTSLFPEQKEKKAAPVKEETPLSIEIDEMQLTGGKISFSDLSRSQPFKTVLDPFELRIDHFSNGKDKKSAFILSVQTEAKENVKLEGDFSLDPLLAEGNIEVKSIPLKKYAPYYRDGILFDIEDGRLDLATRFKYAKGEKDSIYLSGISASLRALRLKKREENADFLKIPTLSVKEGEVDLGKKEIKIGGLSTQKGMLFVKRSKNGEMNLQTLLPPSPQIEDKSQRVEGKQPEAKRPEVKQIEKPWLVAVKQINADRYTIRMEDLTTGEPATQTAENLNLKIQNISTAKGSKAKLSLSFLLNEKGTFSTTGTVGIDPLSANLKMDLKEIGIAPFQPYFTDKVKITVTGGNISTTGDLSVGHTKEKELKITYKGGASLANFSSIDKLNADDFLKLESLYFNDIDAGFNPTSINIKEVALTNFFSRLMINPDGTLNVQQIMVEKESKKETPPSTQKPTEVTSPQKGEETPRKDIKIGQVTLQGGIVDFSDRSVKPDYSAKLGEIGGRISGLSSEENTTAEVELRAKLNDYAPLEITGKINPLREDLYVDLKVRFKDMDLSPMTPYSGKYVGYTIEKGKLSLDLNYLIVKKKLDSQNQIFLDQFTLGDKVESPQATKLPVKLAIALLKNRAGEIKLDIPVKGSLDDPKFSIGKIILQILVNLISKAATSPFALLGAVFGGGEELSYLEFDYGSANVTEPNLKKLSTITKALYDRPSLKLDIEGHVDTERDREGLKQYFFNKKLKVQKLNEMTKKGSPAIPVDEVKIDPKEYGKYLKMAYKDEKFPKPRNVLGLAKDLPDPEMEKLMLTHIEIRDYDLRSLASQRSMKVKDIILKSGQVEPGRIFILEPKSLAPEKKEKLKESRVDFRLK